MNNFVTDCIKGDAFITEINDYIDRWHDLVDSDMPLYSFLGMTKKEYELFVMDENCLSLIITAHKDNVDVLSLYEHLACSVNSKKSKAIERWLKEEVQLS